MKDVDLLTTIVTAKYLSKSKRLNICLYLEMENVEMALRFKVYLCISAFLHGFTFLGARLGREIVPL